MTNDIAPFTKACTDLIGQVAAVTTLAESIIVALASGKLSFNSSPLALSKVLKGAPGGHQLKVFLRAWQLHASHLSGMDVSSMLQSALDCYQLAINRSHIVDTVWTGPEVQGSETRLTEAVVRDIVSGCQSEILIVGYWLVISTKQVEELIGSLIKKAQAGVKVRFVFDPGEKSEGDDNFKALSKLWPSDLASAPREVFSWSDHMSFYRSKSGQDYDRKLHAKVIVSDKFDALVTSANLTHAGLIENLEMGFHVKGSKAGDIIRHFNLLIDEGVLERRE